ncbi:MAG TPA: HNH endonuclease [Acidimicrobiia bacterium]|nr:HNH endonuclease [Acidimicrobiia bacterium]
MGTDDAAAVDFADCEFEELADAARQLHALISSTTAQLLAVLGQMAETPTPLGFARGMVSWMQVNLDVERSTARSYQAAAAALAELPRTAALAGTGVVSWDKLRHATRFAETSDDVVLADELARWNVAQVKQLAAERCRRQRKAEGPPRTHTLRLRNDPDGEGTYLSGWLAGADAERVRSQLERRAEQIGKDHDTRRWAPHEERLGEALVLMAAAAQGRDPDGERALTVVHVDDDVAGGDVEGNAMTTSGLALDDDELLRFACGGRVQFVVSINGVPVGVARAERVTPRWLRRLVERRDGRCRCCGGPIHQIHHIWHWTKGGPTDLDNLVALCWTCHTNVHTRGWRICGDPNGELTFFDEWGKAVTTTVQPLRRSVAKRMAKFDPLARRRFAPAPGVRPPRQPDHAPLRSVVSSKGVPHHGP